jgi:hypothetical protein
MTACLTSAVWFPTAEWLFRHRDFQPDTHFSGCQVLFAMGMSNGWELTSYLQYLLF